jgi:hydrogenase-1 operon protein HyaF
MAGTQGDTMNEFPIPVRAIGPGSQAQDDVELDVMPMPHEMNTFQMPRVPEKVDPAALVQSRDLLARLLADLERWDPERQPQGPRMAMAGIDAAALDITNQVLGEGEVSIQIGGERRFRIQESVFTGLWRCLEFDAQGRLVQDWLEAAAVPRVAIDAARAASADGVPQVDWPPGAMNSPALVAEIGSQLAARMPGARAHAINLTLFPMTPDDHAVLDRALPVGPVAIISRAFGNCRVTSTLTRDVWRVQYFNTMNTLILNTIEVVDVPEVALASPQDLIDSRTRLAELVEWMSEAESAQS